MSLSKVQARRPRMTGKVVVGMDTPGPDEMTIQELEGKRQLIWDESTNEEYLARVREKARDAAKEIKMLAELEAEALRATARHEGYSQGLAEAQEFVDRHIRDISAKAEALFAQLGAQGDKIYQTRRQDVVRLIRLALSKTLKVELSEKRTESLHALMTEALERIDAQRRIEIRCNPEETEELDEFVRTIQDRNPSLKYWVVKADPAIELGGVVVEAEGGKVDNTIETRWKSVEPLFDQLAEQITADDKD
ncbi:Flagellar assembly protein FliH/Type III secretion system HrpE [Pseudodesulfovibrio mercurii]|uniref:Flagellar assembly protein FliH n=1 Tax=Pseudodesulfovibrio mercurii TaxID=641491 RepID=F0JBI2_9BACT|nr:FliH/SctL family protein [Pseudodesulfovibrio mercurii]EGB14301.1 Flagellar assembly protein FliH/Type III secretion system HrpE [Pseudodesulfovibrio mercurii]